MIIGNSCVALKCFEGIQTSFLIVVTIKLFDVVI